MLRARGGKSGQGITVEYAILFFIVMGALVAMSLFNRRAYQAHVFDADKFMITAAANAYGNNIPLQYEPYYLSTKAISGKASNRDWRVDGKVEYQGLNERSATDLRSEQFPPHNATKFLPGW